MKNFIFRKGLDHLIEAGILFSVVDKEIAKSITDLADQITKRMSGVDKTELENKLKGLINE